MTGIRRARPFFAGSCAAVAAMLLPWSPAAFISWLPVAGRPAGAADRTVGVALFYAPSPLATYSGLVPEEYASADLSAKLAAASAGRLAVLPRAQVRTQEGGLRWRESDALRFSRLSDLAHAAGADSLVVGWIESLVLDRLGGGGRNFDIGGEGGGVLSVTTVLVVQVFDASHERIVHQVKFAGHAVGAVRAIVIQGALDDAAQRAAVALAGSLGAAPSAP
jgi:hypothetical protein